MSVKILSLAYLHGPAGARETFEDLVSELIASEYQDARKIRVSQGDGGIDVFVGDWKDPSGIDVYQAKFFPDGVGDSQKEQVRSSFRTANSGERFKMRSWTLCLPCDFSIDEMNWFSKWKLGQATSGVEVRVPWTASKLEGLLTEERNRGTKESFFKEEHLTQIREIHAIVQSLIVPRLEPLSISPAILVPSVENLSLLRVATLENDPVVNVALNLFVKNEGDTLVQNWKIRAVFSKDSQRPDILTTDDYPKMGKGASNILQQLKILPGDRERCMIPFGVRIPGKQMPVNRQLVGRLETVVVELTPVTESGVGIPVSCKLANHINHSEFEAKIQSLCAMPVAFLPRVGFYPE